MPPQADTQGISIMANNPAQIAARIRELRDILEYSSVDVAAKLNISEQEYLDFENNVKSIPISTLYELADLFNVDFTVLLTGEDPKMGDYTLVRSGQGVDVDRYPGYSFQSLAYNFKGRIMEPLYVCLEPHEDEAHEASLVAHGGQEFNLVLEGTVKVVLGKHEFFLNAGDSLYFDPRIPHGQRAVGGPAKFVTIISKDTK